MSIRLIAFDVDGTLFTSEAIVHDAYRDALDRFAPARNGAWPVPSTRTILDQIGKTSGQILKNLFPAITPSETHELGHLIRKNLIRLIHDGRGSLLHGVEDTLRALQISGYQLRLASNGNPNYVEAIVTHYRLDRFFGPFVAVDGQDTRDKGDVLNTYKSLLGVHDRELCMVGDRESDLNAARKAGCHFIGLLCGHGSPAELDAPEAVLLKSFVEIPMALARLK